MDLDKGKAINWKAKLFPHLGDDHHPHHHHHHQSLSSSPSSPSLPSPSSLPIRHLPVFSSSSSLTTETTPFHKTVHSPSSSSSSSLSSQGGNRGGRGKRGLSEVEHLKNGENVLVALRPLAVSNDLGLLCECVQCSMILIEEHPLPTIITSVYKLLFEMFRDNSNVLRYMIVRAFQNVPVETHLLVQDIDSVLKPLSTVLSSNDSSARALALRLLGGLCVLLPQREDIHHSLWDCFSSNNPHEVKAAVYAIKMVTAHSETFAQGTIRRIAPLLGSVSTSPEQKLQLVPLIQEASHNPNMVKEARDIVTTFLSHAPSQPYLFSSLSSLHQLTTRSLFLVGEQVGLLVGVLEGELREGVRRWVVGLLGDLVPVAGPLYDYKAELLISLAAQEGQSPSLSLASLRCLHSLSLHTPEQLLSPSSSSSSPSSSSDDVDMTAPPSSEESVKSPLEGLFQLKNVLCQAQSRMFLTLILVNLSSSLSSYSLSSSSSSSSSLLSTLLASSSSSSSPPPSLQLLLQNTALELLLQLLKERFLEGKGERKPEGEGEESGRMGGEEGGCLVSSYDRGLCRVMRTFGQIDKNCAHSLTKIAITILQKLTDPSSLSLLSSSPYSSMGFSSPSSFLSLLLLLNSSLVSFVVVSAECFLDHIPAIKEITKRLLDILPPPSSPSSPSSPPSLLSKNIITLLSLLLRTRHHLHNFFSFSLPSPSSSSSPSPSSSPSSPKQQKKIKKIRDHTIPHSLSFLLSHPSSSLLSLSFENWIHLGREALFSANFEVGRWVFEGCLAHLNDVREIKNSEGGKEGGGEEGRGEGENLLTLENYYFSFLVLFCEGEMGVRGGKRRKGILGGGVKRGGGVERLVESQGRLLLVLGEGGGEGRRGGREKAPFVYLELRIMFLKLLNKIKGFLLEIPSFSTFSSSSLSSSSSSFFVDYLSYLPSLFELGERIEGAGQEMREVGGRFRLLSQKRKEKEERKKRRGEGGGVSEGGGGGGEGEIVVEKHAFVVFSAAICLLRIGGLCKYYATHQGKYYHQSQQQQEQQQQQPQPPPSIPFETLPEAFRKPLHRLTDSLSILSPSPSPSSSSSLYPPPPSIETFCLFSEAVSSVVSAVLRSPFPPPPFLFVEN